MTSKTLIAIGEDVGNILMVTGGVCTGVSLLTGIEVKTRVTKNKFNTSEFVTSSSISEFMTSSIPKVLFSGLVILVGYEIKKFFQDIKKNLETE